MKGDCGMQGKKREEKHTQNFAKNEEREGHSDKYLLSVY